MAFAVKMVFRTSLLCLLLCVSLAQSRGWRRNYLPRLSHGFHALRRVRTGLQPHRHNQYHNGIDVDGYTRNGRDTSRVEFLADSRNPADKESLMALAASLDPQSCMPKLLCHLREDQTEPLTHCDVDFLEIFGTMPTQHLDKSGYKLRPTPADRLCEKLYYRCPLTNDQLAGMLRHSWGCPETLSTNEAN